MIWYGYDFFPKLVDLIGYSANQMVIRYIFGFFFAIFMPVNGLMINDDSILCTVSGKTYLTWVSIELDEEFLLDRV